eukprot:1019380-Alexandrium_andersonii.AAC.1
MRGDSEREGSQAPPGLRRPPLDSQPTAAMGLGEQPGSMPRSKQEPLKGSRLPGATGVAGEVIHERGNPRCKGAARCMEDRI